MSKDNDCFFTRKCEWSVLKDDLLKCYLVPYLQKILATRRELLYIDGFAGKGMFDDGSKGSPAIACECIRNALANSRVEHARASAVFIEKKYAQDLQKNVAQFGFASGVKGDYGELSEALTSADSRNGNLFLHVDPYGVKSLDQGFFLNLGRRFSSVELLINFNSFGFFRAACSAVGVRFRDLEAEDSYLVERDPGLEDTPSESERRLSCAAGGDYWRDIVRDYRNGGIDGYEAEERLAFEYCDRLSSGFTYVQNLSIRIKESNHPKYRMVHATNHPEGCLLMYDQMHKRLIDMKTIQHGGQGQLFPTDDIGSLIDDREVRSKLLSHIGSLDDYTQLECVLADFVIENGLTLPLGDLRAAVKEFECSNTVDVRRFPPTTKCGNATAFMQSSASKGKRIEVRGKRV